VTQRHSRLTSGGFRGLGALALGSRGALNEGILRPRDFPGHPD
jgi:hypothetical protein